MASNYERTIKVHDTGPSVKGQVRKSSGAPLPLTGASVRFLMYSVDGVALVDAPAFIELPTTEGIMRYDWQPDDTLVVGRHRALFELTLDGGAKESYPNEGYMWITIEEDLNNV